MLEYLIYDHVAGAERLTIFAIDDVKFRVTASLGGFSRCLAAHFAVEQSVAAYIIVIFVVTTDRWPLRACFRRVGHLNRSARSQ